MRPGFTCTAEITTATRKNVVSVPIQALTVREMLYNDKDELVREKPQRRRRGANVEPTVSASNEPPPGHTRKETEGVFVVTDDRGVFTPVKVGVAGEQYFEVLTGLKAGDQVITGPFASVRELSDGGRRQSPGERTNAESADHYEMNQILDSIVIALQAIWANKLRSFMTVLGNIVAVTSIVTVVTLIQGMNGMVADAIVSDIGADNFTVQRMPPIFNEDEAERNRNNPLITVDEAEAIRRFSPLIVAVAAQAGRNATVSYRTEEIDNASIQGVTASYCGLFDVQCRARADDEHRRSGTRTAGHDSRLQPG